jgi:hypothetical protein
MALANNLTTLNGLFKEVYADKLENIIPDGVKLMKMVSFVGKDQQNGSLYHQPVVLGLEHGVTFATSGDAFTLNDAVAGTIKDAQVQGTQMVLRSVLSYTAAARAVSGGPKAFESATKFLVANMIRSIARKLEIELLYGQMGYATVTSQSSSLVTLTPASWAPGIWAGAEGMSVSFIANDDSAVLCTAPIASVDMENRTITIGTPTAGSANAIGTEIGASGVDSVTVYHAGAFGNEFAGIHKILTNTGTLFNISASTYALWRGNEYDAGSAALSFAKITAAVGRAVEKGLDGDVTVLVNPRTWNNLMTDQAALRKYDSSFKSGEMENGAKSVKFYGQNGAIEVTPSIYVKEGFAYVLNFDELIRVGSTDVTFKRPGQGDEFFRDLDTAAGYELRAFTDQAVFCAAPGKMVLIKNIVNS